MTVLTFNELLFGVSFFAGIIGALTGLGGGVILTPALVLLFGVNIHYAMGASLISVIATSSGTAVAYLKEGFTNMRIGMFLETGTVIGALIGALLISFFSKSALSLIFGVVLILSAYLTWRHKTIEQPSGNSHPWAVALKLEGTYPTSTGTKSYSVQRVPLAWGVMSFAGLISGLLGIGSGALKVLAMDHVMQLPYKVATTTSNFIIGITAAVSAGIYFANGYVDPIITFPVVIGVTLGAFTGTKILVRVRSTTLRTIFIVVIVILAIQMIYKGLAGSL
ncbi:MAG: sulfite exporter TauE/SafE family protein [Proteobacteria bacterium]|nr:sulfite exporter TauE/SafE family protein [Pseudomonadota bacterium]